MEAVISAGTEFNFLKIASKEHVNWDIRSFA
jgi:hypothetical protein